LWIKIRILCLSVLRHSWSIHGSYAAASAASQMRGPVSPRGGSDSAVFLVRNETGDLQTEVH
jgi:hypothetical protein